MPLRLGEEMIWRWRISFLRKLNLAKTLRERVFFYSRRKIQNEPSFMKQTLVLFDSDNTEQPCQHPNWYFHLCGILPALSVYLIHIYGQYHTFSSLSDEGHPIESVICYLCGNIPSKQRVSSKQAATLKLWWTPLICYAYCHLWI